METTLAADVARLLIRTLAAVTARPVPAATDRRRSRVVLRTTALPVALLLILTLAVLWPCSGAAPAAVSGNTRSIGFHGPGPGRFSTGPGMAQLRA